MELIKIENLSFTYPNQNVKALKNINLSFKKGEFITICGKSGCGKTTLLRLLKPSLAPYGTSEGNILFEGIPLKELSHKSQTIKTGFVMQSPDNQIVTDKVWHELAFGLESLGCKTPEIRAKVAEMASFFGIENWFHKKVSQLSGGQKQLLNLASVMVMQPSLLILDEPTSQLDPISAGEFLKSLEKINRELGTTIILTEHRLEDVFPISDRVIVMENGKIIADGEPKDVGFVLRNTQNDMYGALPTPMKVYLACDTDSNCPVTVREGRKWLEDFSEKNTLDKDAIPEATPFSGGETVIETKDLWFRYEKNSADVIKGLDIKVSRGELFAILGGNGTGKTTALSLISGLNIPYSGEIYINGEKLSKIKNLYDGMLGYLPQNVQSVFAKKSVYLDLQEMEEDAEKIKEMALLCRIENLLESHPYDLSGGEQQRTALAKILLKKPQILLLDEPTKGMDAQFKEEFAEILKALKQKGVTIIMVSHDIEFCAEYADRCAMFFDGNITSCLCPREFFADKSFYTTSANKMARSTIENAILADDIIKACKGHIPQKKKPLNYEFTDKSSEKETELPLKELCMPKQKLSKRTLLAMLFILIAIPLTILFGYSCLDNKKYYFISLLIIFETMIPFFFVFESRKPRARELVVISVLCGIGVVGRTAFMMLPQFKPTLAIVIISAICLGGETGFLVGAVTAFVSNFFFGQGPWTPWQMFALGIIGFLAGILFKKGLIRKTKLSLCIFGFITAFVIYGAIMNSHSVLQATSSPNFKMFITAFSTGAPLDMIHGISTAFFLWLGAEAMIDKIERIKVKYGLLKDN